MTKSENLQARVADWIYALDTRMLSPKVVEKLKLATLDTLAAILSGVNEAVTQKIMPFATVPADRAEASILGFTVRADLRSAALANGTMAHACDYDDSSWTMWGHPTAPVLPAVLAIAEYQNKSGLDFLVGLAAGIEIEKTLGLGCQPEHYDRGYHPTGSLGVFGAAAGAAKMLGLDSQGTCMALGISASRAAGLRGNSGTMTKPLHVGFAARDGVEAALFAQAGVTASPNVIAGALGFFDVCAPDHGELNWITERLGNPFEVIEPGLSPKLYPIMQRNPLGDRRNSCDARGGTSGVGRPENPLWHDSGRSRQPRLSRSHNAPASQVQPGVLPRRAARFWAPGNGRV